MAQTAHVAIERVPLETSRPELLPWTPWANDPTLEGSKTMAAKAPNEWFEGYFRFAVIERVSFTWARSPGSLTVGWARFRPRATS